jgi:NTE family protein
MGAFALESDATLGPAAAQQRRAMVAARLPRQEWPNRPMIVPAVNAHTGQLVAFDRDSVVDFVDAVTASTALPGTVPTHKIPSGSRSGPRRMGESLEAETRCSTLGKAVNFRKAD